MLSPRNAIFALELGHKGRVGELPTATSATGKGLHNELSKWFELPRCRRPITKNPIAKVSNMPTALEVELKNYAHNLVADHVLYEYNRQIMLWQRHINLLVDAQKEALDKHQKVLSDARVQIEKEREASFGFSMLALTFVAARYFHGYQARFNTLGFRSSHRILKNAPNWLALNLGVARLPLKSGQQTLLSNRSMTKYGRRYSAI